MGDRGQVRLVSEGKPDIYLYSHWGASDLPTVVAKALDRGRPRWGDDEYLNRIIFNEMTRGLEFEETGFGIGTSLHGDVWRVVSIDHDNKQIAVIDDGTVGIQASFEKFIELYSLVKF
jgi:hypothetical protein